MSKYLKLFETTSQYEAYMGGGEKILPNVSLIEETYKVEYNPYIPPQPITYTASEKLVETTSSSSSGLHTNAFNTTIKSHTFENGVGTIEFDDSVTSIGDDAFYGCTDLTSITIPNSVTSIGGSAFYQCSSLTSIDIPNSVTSISGFAFSQCVNLTSVNIPNSVTSIGFYTFQSCRSLTSIDIPDSITSIEGNAFSGCSGLTSIIIPNSVTSIGDSAFSSCSGLTSITIPDSVTNIGRSAFYICRNLASVTVEATTPPTLGSMAFDSNASGRKIYVPSASIDAYKAVRYWSDYAYYIEAIPTT